MEPFLELQVGDEIEILSDSWDEELYSLSTVGDGWSSVGKIVAIHSIVPYYCRNAPEKYYNSIRYRDRGHIWILPPIASVIRPIEKNLFYYSKSNFLKFDSMVEFLYHV